MQSMINHMETTDRKSESYSEQYWAANLIECIKDMGSIKTNAVLISLDGATSIKPFQRYPEAPYYFGDEYWRAFYHCHESANKCTEEHGHYHFFTRAKRTDSWSHVVAMGIDNVGQPMRLFTTNLWVTDGDWFNSSLLTKQINILHNNKENKLITNWFKYMLLLFLSEINDLIRERDEKISALSPARREQYFHDHTIYNLSEVKINLNERLYQLFNSNPD